ncbi:MAG: xanthine dehydrogenase family protein molybdopterin-binding subunit [Deltaproteobacteria bacterium]|nr:xanthine dehydrogenase family protein molybdopterin-binding subunit [Deltaproteobacteria bacterium]
MKKDRNLQDSEIGFLLNRRDFIKITGAGLFVFFTVGDMDLLAQRRGFGSDYPEDFNAYLRIGDDGRVTCFSGKIEMGQGVITSLAQMLAEELDVELTSVDMIMGDTALCPFDFATVGSRSTKFFGPPLRKAAAEARAVLIQLAAESLHVNPDRLYTENGVIRDRQNRGTRIPYGQLAKGKRIERHLKKDEVVIKHYSKHKISGKATLRTDSLEKVTGKAKFAGDIILPGMLYAKILRPPAHNSRLTKVDVSAAKEIKDAMIIEEEDLIAALHEVPEQAEKALDRIKAEYETPPSDLNNKNIFEYLEKAAPNGQMVTQKGNIDDGRKQAAVSIQSKFLNHYVAHAPIETHTAVAAMEKDGMRVWASTQAPFMVQNSVAQATGLSPEKVRVLPVHVGGGFGGKTTNLETVEAARLTKLTGRPVQVAMTRREEFFYDAVRPAAIVRAESGLDKEGKINYWNFDILLAGSRSSEPIYDIPHQRVYARGGGFGQESIHPFRTGAWRGPGSNTNVFAMESQTDIMAQAAGIDPLSFRLKNLADKRMERVLKAAADKFGHSFTKGPSGEGVGIALTDYLGTYVATMAQVKVDKENGHVRIERMVCAQDMGEIINPQGAKLQIEGGITMAIGAALSEELQFKGGAILTENFDSYEITRFSGAPQIDVVLIENNDMAPQGCGEPACTTVGAVLANAVCDAIGVRLYELPMTSERIKKAMMNT